MFQLATSKVLYLKRLVIHRHNNYVYSAFIIHFNFQINKFIRECFHSVVVVRLSSRPFLPRNDDHTRRLLRH